MHSIERYGIVALLFLVVTVVAVLMWDGNKEKKEAEVPGRLAAAASHAPVAPAVQADESRRLSLLAESQPGPLQRHPRAERGADFGSPSEPLSATPLSENAPDAAPGTLELQAPREQPAPEQVIGLKAAGPTQALAASARTYAVRTGDTLSEIAQRELGSARRWQELVSANPGLDPSKLRVGQSIRIPGAPALGGEPRTAAVNAAAPKQGAAPKPAAPAKAGASGKTWKVGQGENLWRIAERALGDGKRWREIASLNPKVNPDKLLLGQELVLPGSAQAPARAPDKKSGTSNPKLAVNPPKAKGDSVILASASRSEGARRGGKVK